MTPHLVAIAVPLLWAAPALAQTSTSYRLTEAVVNAGGHPAQGTVLASAGYRISLDAIGDGVLGDGLESASYRLDGGFIAAYPPPGEVSGNRFASKTQLLWSPERSVGTYHAYRNTLASLPGAFGTCLASEVLTTSLTEVAVPVVGTGFFYLVTAKNRLDEEGTKGRQSNGAVRPNSIPCP
jgi:hypothetical protein